MSTLVHLGEFAPSPIRNARPAPGSKDYNYVRENIRLERWALKKYGKHDRLAYDRTELPRLPRREAKVLAKWWKDVAGDVRGTDQHSREVRQGIEAMQAAARGHGQELTPTEAAEFWQGMKTTALAIGVVKMLPDFSDKVAMLWESLVESAEELPDRLVDQGKKLGEDLQEGVDRVVTAAKWAGAIGGGLLTIYVLSRIVPDRKRTDDLT